MNGESYEQIIGGVTYKSWAGSSVLTLTDWVHLSLSFTQLRLYLHPAESRDYGRTTRGRVYFTYRNTINGHYRLNVI